MWSWVNQTFTQRIQFKFHGMINKFVYLINNDMLISGFLWYLGRQFGLTTNMLSISYQNQIIQFIIRFPWVNIANKICEKSTKIIKMIISIVIFYIYYQCIATHFSHLLLSRKQITPNSKANPQQKIGKAIEFLILLHTNTEIYDLNECVNNITKNEILSSFWLFFRLFLLE